MSFGVNGCFDSSTRSLHHNIGLSGGWLKDVHNWVRDNDFVLHLWQKYGVCIPLVARVFILLRSCILKPQVIISSALPFSCKPFFPIFSEVLSNKSEIGS